MTKQSSVNHPLLSFNNRTVSTTPFQKHLGLDLDHELNFKKHVNEKISTANKGIGVIKKLSNFVPRSTLLLVYKLYVRPHLDYADIINDQPLHESFIRSVDSIQ